MRQFDVVGRGAVEILVCCGLALVEGANAVWIGVAAELAAGLITLVLGRGNLAVEPAEEVNELGVVVDMGFRVIGAGEFLEQNLREAGGSGLEAYLRQFGGVVAAKKIEEVILFEAIFQGLLLGEGPFEIAAGSPIGNIALGDAGEAGIFEGGDDISEGNGIPDHAIDHVALKVRETGNAGRCAVLCAGCRRPEAGRSRWRRGQPVMFGEKQAPGRLGRRN